MKKRGLILFFVILALASGMMLFYAVRNIRIKLNAVKIAYHKEAKLNYVTNLKDNKFYDENVLQDNFMLVASLIDSFKLDFNYYYTLSEDIDYILTYNVDGVLEVYDSDDNTKPIGRTAYEFIPKTTTSDYKQIIKVELFNQIIDYQTYNEIVQNWKKEISPEAVLKISFNVRWSGYSKTLEKEISDNHTSTLEIPISNKTVNIRKPASVNEDGDINKDSKLPTKYMIMIISPALLLASSLLMVLLLCIDSAAHKDQYEMKIKKILREFDRAITEARGSFKKSSKDNNIEVNDFLELMDVHDNLNIPIIFYRDNANKSTFVVRNEKTVYYCIIKRDNKSDK